MIALTEQEKDVIDRFRQLPPDRQKNVMLALFGSHADQWKAFQGQGERQLIKSARERGLDWEKLNDEQRQDFVDQLLHEDRA